METVNMFLQTPLLQITSAILGSVVGSLVTDPTKNYGIRISILMTIVSMIAAGAIAEYFAVAKDMTYVWVHAGIGVGVGLVCQFAVEEIKQSAPKFFKLLLALLTSNFINNLADALDLLFDGIKRLIKRWLPK